MCLFTVLEIHDINDICVIDGATGSVGSAFWWSSQEEGNVVMFTLNAVLKKRSYWHYSCKTIL